MRQFCHMCHLPAVQRFLGESQSPNISHFRNDVHLQCYVRKKGPSQSVNWFSQISAKTKWMKCYVSKKGPVSWLSHAAAPEKPVRNVVTSCDDL